MEEQPVENQPLSASKIKKLEDCSWLFYTSYILKTPDSSNEGAMRGSIVHTIFELLLNPRHLKNFKRITKKKSIEGDKGITKLVKRLLDAQGIHSPENYKMVDEMIVCGLTNDFFIKNGELLGAELKFDIKNESPSYYIRGFIDKPFKVGSKIIIDDFKSSKAKFEGEEIESNIQGMMYSLAAKKLFPDLTPEVRFIFLRFPEDPMVKVKFNENTLKGFEAYLAYVQQRINSFSEEDAKKNYAFDQPERPGFHGQVLCGRSKFLGHLKKDGNVMWACPAKFPFKYYALKAADGSTIKTSMKNDLSPKEGEKVIELSYGGCPRHRPAIDAF